MRLIVGLGNPGERYNGTRHNTGFLVVEKLKNEIPNSKFQITNQIQNINFQLEDKFSAEIFRLGKLILAKPQTFMNESGEAVFKIAAFYKIKQNDLYVVHDDLDIKLGEYKIQKGVGPRLHYGIQSIENKIGSKDFWRVRIGVDNRGSENRTDGEKYVLQRFTEEERVILNEVIKKVVDNLSNIIQV